MPHSNYLPERMGTAEISPVGSFEAGSFESLTLIYTAGYFNFRSPGIEVGSYGDSYRGMEGSIDLEDERAFGCLTAV